MRLRPMVADATASKFLSVTRRLPACSSRMRCASCPWLMPCLAMSRLKVAYELSSASRSATLPTTLPPDRRVLY